MTNVERCQRCQYALVRGDCPICEGKKPGTRQPDAFLPPDLHAIPVTREQFISSQHFEAWKAGRPLLRHLEHRKKFTREERDLFFKHRRYQCATCPSTSQLTLDHIVPQIFGGSSKDINLRPLCLTCNRKAFLPYRPVLELVKGAA
jgi:5-methylcytosine-specific restriction endonuclease McrA